MGLGHRSCLLLPVTNAGDSQHDVLRSAFDVHMAQRSSELVSKVSLKTQDATAAARQGSVVFIATANVIPFDVQDRYLQRRWIHIRENSGA